MENKKDLRFVKTEKLIEETYITLRKSSNKPVKVSDLCETALINKTTFYDHYENIEFLHKHICEKTMAEILSSCPHIEDAFTDTESFVYSIMNALEKNQKIIKIIFKNDENAIINNVEECLLKIYFKGNEPADLKMKMIFAIGGASRLIIKCRENNCAEETIALLKKLF